MRRGVRPALTAHARAPGMSTVTVLATNRARPGLSGAVPAAGLSHRPGRRARRSPCLSCSVHSRVRPPAHGDSQMNDRMPPQADGLYDPRYEHDACGVAMVARLDNVPGHDVVAKALEALDNLEHRGAEGADIRTGDGAGILVQLPHAFFRSAVDFELPERGRYGVAMCFLPDDATHRRKIEELLELNARIEGQRVLGWRDVPVDDAHVGDTANASRPAMRQLFIGAGEGFTEDQDAFERKLYVIRRIVELAAGPDFYAPSFSSRTVVYKGMLISHQLRGFYPD